MAEDYCRVRIIFDWPDDSFISADTYSLENGQRLAAKVAACLEPSACVVVEHVVSRQDFWGERLPAASSTSGEGGT